MGKWMKAMSLGFTVMAAVAEAMSAESEEGENISQTELVRICVRTGVSAIKAYGGTVANLGEGSQEEFARIIKEELEEI